MNVEQDILIGVDAGTSVIKCVAFTPRGEVIASTAIENEYRTFDDNHVEQDMHLTREKLLDTLSRLTQALGDDRQNIKALAVTAQGDGMWVVDESGEPLHDGWLWLDSRSASVVTEYESSETYSQLFQTTGTAVNASQMRSQMRWLDKHDPQLLDRATTCYHCKDYLYQQLTGIRATDPSEALFTFGDYKTGDYSDSVLAQLDLSHRRALLPDIVSGFDRADRLLDQMADRTGLPRGTPVTLGFIDVMCTGFGGGLYEPGKIAAMSVLGTTGIHMRFSPNAESLVLPVDKTGYTIAFPGGGHAQLQSNMSGTLNLDWLVGLVQQSFHFKGETIEPKEVLNYLDTHLLDATPNSALYHPYISTAGERGPFVNADASASLFGLNNNCQLLDVARSVYEGVCFAARDCYSALGPLPDEVRVSGGGSNSMALKKIFASVMGCPVREIDQPEAGASGVAMIAAIFHGYYPSRDECVADWVSPRIADTVEPDAALGLQYSDAFDLYQSMQGVMQDFWTVRARKK